MSPDADSQPLSERVDEAGYPRETLEALTDRAHEIFDQNHSTDDQGDSGEQSERRWFGVEPRWPLQSSVRERFRALDAAASADYDAALRHAALALNHTLFALENVERAPDLDVETDDVDAEDLKLPRLDTRGYPAETLGALVAEAEERFAARLDEHGSGKNWANSNPQWDFEKAIDEQFCTRQPAQARNYHEAVKYEANAVNHTLFALENAAREAGVETSGDG